MASTRWFAPDSGVMTAHVSPAVSRGEPWFPSERLPPGLIRPMATAWWGPGGHFVHYFVRRGELVNCVGVVEKSGWEVESWTERGDHAEFAADFVGWHDDIRRLIDNVDSHSLFKWALHDREPMPRWGQGRVTLLGDACHPTCRSWPRARRWPSRMPRSWRDAWRATKTCRRAATLRTPAPRPNGAGPARVPTQRHPVPPRRVQGVAAQPGNRSRGGANHG